MGFPAARVGDLQHRRVTQQFPKRRQIHPGQRVDQAHAGGIGHLDQAEFRDVGEFSDKFAVVRERAGPAQALDEASQPGVGRDQGGGVRRDQRMCRDRPMERWLGRTGMGGFMALSPVLSPPVTPSGGRTSYGRS